ncbi:MAG: hypothetical protein JO292_00265, partial [Betaproteobacteria bacterium]|nr:hypothetical protein [Betaproteobacteria bacterium]MBV9359796.1 hypothetical protein [Betaproteobacteria bacterium]
MRVLSIVCSIAVAACAGAPRHDGNDGVKAEGDEYLKDWFITGPILPAPEAIAGFGVLEGVALGASSEDGGSLYSIQVVDIFRRSWRYYDAAYDIDGERFKAENIGWDMSCTGPCQFSEHLSIPITRSYLTRHLSTGINMKVVGRGGEARLSIPADYIARLLDAAKPLTTGSGLALSTVH